jgi:hypothetical protein
MKCTERRKERRKDEWENIKNKHLAEICFHFGRWVELPHNPV